MATKSIEPADLQHFPLFRDLSEHELEKIQPLMQQKQYSTGGEIITEGSQGNLLYLLLEGEVEISKKLTMFAAGGELDERNKSLTKLSHSDYPIFGEIALLMADGARSATVRALTTCNLGMFDCQELLALMHANPEIGFKVMRNVGILLAVRLKNANQDILKLTTAFTLALQG